MACPVVVLMFRLAAVISEDGVQAGIDSTPGGSTFAFDPFGTLWGYPKQSTGRKYIRAV